MDIIAYGKIPFIQVGVPFAERPILDYPHENQQTANARLIAAAPDLLACLISIQSMLAQIPAAETPPDGKPIPFASTESDFNRLRLMALDVCMDSIATAVTAAIAKATQPTA